MNRRQAKMKGRRVVGSYGPPRKKAQKRASNKAIRRLKLV